MWLNHPDDKSWISYARLRRLPQYELWIVFHVELDSHDVDIPGQLHFEYDRREVLDRFQNFMNSLQLITLSNFFSIL